MLPGSPFNKLGTFKTPSPWGQLKKEKNVKQGAMCELLPKSPLKMWACKSL